MKYAVISIFSLIVLSALVSAEMTITHTETVYNLEDTLSLTAIVRATQNANDFLRISLHCGEQDVELYRAPLSLGAGASREMSLEVVLTKAILGSLYGICTVRGHVNAINSALNLRFDGLVTNGSFALNFTIPESMPVGRHVIALNGYETDNSGERTNEGTIETTLIIKSVLR